MPTAAPAIGYANRGVTQPPTWHGLVAWDMFLNAAATGLFLAAAVGELARPALVAPLAVWAYPIALVLLLADLTCLVLDLGDRLRFHHMLRVFKPGSPMSLGTWCLTAFSLPLTLMVVAELLAPAAGWFLTVCVVAGLPFAFGSAAYKGVLFSTTAQPGWRGARWLGGYHVSGAVAFGCAGLVLLDVVAGDHSAAAALRVAFGLLVALNAAALGLLAAELRPALAVAFPGGERVAFAAAVSAGGVLLPLALLAVGGRVAEVAAAVLVLAAGFAVRWVIVRLPHAARIPHARTDAVPAR
jgi:hypothetical protein